MAFMTKAYVDTAHGQVHYRYALPTKDASRDKTVLLLHKSASSSASYEAIARQLVAAGYSCYAPDMPGFGNSFDPDEDVIELISQQGTRFYVDLFLKAFRSLGVVDPPETVSPLPVHIIGHHSGACLAMEMAAVYPKLVASITLIGPAVMTAAERAEMKKNYFTMFNQPVADGSHLQRTWDYLRHMGVGEDLQLFQREAIDHIRAWRGRNLIYGAVWNQEMETLFAQVQCPILLVCAPDDVLFDHYKQASLARPDAATFECSGANFSPDLDSTRIATTWLNFVKQ